eukprot:2529106-Prymnesium_polylepis.1
MLPGKYPREPTRDGVSTVRESAANPAEHGADCLFQQRRWERVPRRGGRCSINNAFSRKAEQPSCFCPLVRQPCRFEL